MCHAPGVMFQKCDRFQIIRSESFFLKLHFASVAPFFLTRQLNLELTGGEMLHTETHAFPFFYPPFRVWQDCTIEGKAPSELVAAAAQGLQGLQGGPISIEGTGGVLVIEILGREEDVSDDAAAKFFFDDLAESNGAIAEKERRIDFAQVASVGSSGDNLMPRLDKTATACTCIGVQRVALGKDRRVGGESEPRSDHWAVRVEMCVLRLVMEETDLLISLTRPIQDGSDKTMEDIMEASTHSKLFLEIIETFAIQNWELFG